MQYKYKKEVILDQERSKIGLGDVYEKDYLKQQEAAATTGGLQEKPTENVNNPKHDEIRKLMQSLFIKLDALSNFHFTNVQSTNFHLTNFHFMNFQFFILLIIYVFKFFIF